MFIWIFWSLQFNKSLIPKFQFFLSKFSSHCKFFHDVLFFGCNNKCILNYRIYWIALFIFLISMLLFVDDDALNFSHYLRNLFSVLFLHLRIFRKNDFIVLFFFFLISKIFLIKLIGWVIADLQYRCKNFLRWGNFRKIYTLILFLFKFEARVKMLRFNIRHSQIYIKEKLIITILVHSHVF